MSLNVAVQMDPIDRINIAGDSTFALLLEAQARGHTLYYYTTDRLAMRDGNVFATVEPLQVRDTKGDHFTLGAPERVALETFDVILMRQDPPFDMNYVTATHLLERVSPQDPGGERSHPCAQRAGEDLRHRIPGPDAADFDHPRPR
jgi:glutathione synthase